MDFSQIILVANVLATWFMVGLIWMVQIVHYPLFKDVGPENYVRYQHQHQSRITWIVAPVMLIEIGTGFLMVYYPASGVAEWIIYVGVISLVIIWLSTALLQVPCHARLANGFQTNVYHQLVLGNWIRTFAWTLRGVLVAYLLSEVLTQSTAISGVF